MLNEFHTFLTNKGLNLNRSREILSNKLTYMLNDQLIRYSTTPTKKHLMEFIYDNAAIMNNNDTIKISDFFSKVYNTMHKLDTSIFEIKTFLNILNNAENNKGLVNDYLTIRTVILSMAGLLNDIRIQTSVIKLSPLDFVSVLKAFNTNRDVFNEFLVDNGLPVNIDYITVDILVHFYISDQKRAKEALLVIRGLDVKKFKRLMLIKRVKSKLSTYLLIVRIMKVQNSMKETNRHYEVLRQLRRMIRENTYKRDETLKTLLKSFMDYEWGNQTCELVTVKEGFESKLSEEKNRYFMMLSNKIGLNNDKGKELANHTVQLLCLKQLADMKRLLKETEDMKSSKKYDELKLNDLRRDIVICEFFRRETIEGLRNITTDAWQDIIKRKFVKSEDFDRELISFIKKTENSLITEINKRMKERNHKINESIDMIRNTPLMDDISAFLDENIEFIKPSTRLPELISIINHQRFDKDLKTYTDKISSKSRILTKTYNDKNIKEQKSTVFCLKCKNLLGSDSPIDTSVNRPFKAELEEFEEKLIRYETDANAAILNYINKKRNRVSLMYRPSVLPIFNQNTDSKLTLFRNETRFSGLNANESTRGFDQFTVKDAHESGLIQFLIDRFSTLLPPPIKAKTMSQPPKPVDVLSKINDAKPLRISRLPPPPVSVPQYNTQISLSSKLYHIITRKSTLPPTIIPYRSVSQPPRRLNHHLNNPETHIVRKTTLPPPPIVYRNISMPVPNINRRSDLEPPQIFRKTTVTDESNNGKVAFNLSLDHRSARRSSLTPPPIKKKSKLPPPSLGAVNSKLMIKAILKKLNLPAPPVRFKSSMPPPPVGIRSPSLLANSLKNNQITISTTLNSEMDHSYPKSTLTPPPIDAFKAKKIVDAVSTKTDLSHLQLADRPRHQLPPLAKKNTRRMIMNILKKTEISPIGNQNESDLSPISVDSFKAWVATDQVGNKSTLPPPPISKILHSNTNGMNLKVSGNNFIDESRISDLPPPPIDIKKIKLIYTAVNRKSDLIPPPIRKKSNLPPPPLDVLSVKPILGAIIRKSNLLPPPIRKKSNLPPPPLDPLKTKIILRAITRKSNLQPPPIRKKSNLPPPLLSSKSKHLIIKAITKKANLSPPPIRFKSWLPPPPLGKKNTNFLTKATTKKVNLEFSSIASCEQKKYQLIAKKNIRHLLKTMFKKQNVPLPPSRPVSTLPPPPIEALKAILLVEATSNKTSVKIPSLESKKKMEFGSIAKRNTRHIAKVSCKKYDKPLAPPLPVSTLPPPPIEAFKIKLITRAISRKTNLVAPPVRKKSNLPPPSLTTINSLTRQKSKTCSNMQTNEVNRIIGSKNISIIKNNETDISLYLDKFNKKTVSFLDLKVSNLSFRNINASLITDPNLLTIGKQNAAGMPLTAPNYPAMACSDGRRMIPVFWDQLNHNQITSTLWTDIIQKDHNIPLNKILEYFEYKSTSKNVSNKRLSKIAAIDLIFDEGRSKALISGVNLLLNIYKLSWDDIVKMIYDIDESKIGYYNFIALKKIAPLKLELEKARAYNDNVELLDPASRWVYEIRHIHRFNQRIDALALCRDLENRYQTLKDFIVNFYDTCEMFKENAAFHRFLRVCLDAGNILNTDTVKGNTYGFKTSSLKEFIACTSIVKTGISLMEYILIEVSLNNPKLLDFIENLRTRLESSVSCNIEDVVDEVIELKGRFNLLRAHLELAEHEDTADVGFIAKFEEFFILNGEKIMILEEEGLQTKEFYYDTMSLLGENEGKLRVTKSKEHMADFQSIFGKMYDIVAKIYNL